MAQYASKGTVLQVEISSVYTTVAQTIDIDGPEEEVVTWEALHLGSGVGVPYLATGFSEGGTVNGNLWFDPAAATVDAIYDLIESGALGNFKVVWSDSGTTEFAFAAAPKIKPAATPRDGLKASFSLKLNGLASRT